MPTFPPETRLGDAIVKVSEFKLGLGVAVKEGIVMGLFTDGDIRRAIEKWQADFFIHTVSDIMTRNPKTVTPMTNISEIQHLMNKYTIHAVLVVDDTNQLLGIIDHHTCLI